MAEFDFENGLDVEPEHLILPEGMDHREVGVGQEPPFGELEFLFTGFDDTIIGPTEGMPVAKRAIVLKFEISDTEDHKYKRMKHQEMAFIGSDDDPKADGGPLKDIDLKKRTWKANFKPIRLFLEAARVAKNRDYTVMLNNAVGVNVVGTVQKKISKKTGREFRNITAYYPVGTKALRSLDDEGRPLVPHTDVVLASFADRKVGVFEND